MKKKIVIVFLILSSLGQAQNKFFFEQKSFNYYRDSILKLTPQFNKIFVNKYLQKNDYSKFSAKTLKLNNLNLTDTVSSKLYFVAKEIAIQGNKKFVITSNFVNKFPNIYIHSVTRFANKNIVVIDENYKLYSKQNYIILDNKGIVLKSYTVETIK